jgi:hypothetical protein
MRAGLTGFTPLAVSPLEEAHRLPPMLGICAGLLALGIVWLFWWIVGHAITAAHEGGHALVGRSFGFKITSMKLLRSRSGVTEFAGVGGAGAILTGLAGYLGPSAFGFGGAVLLAGGRAVAVLWISLVFLAVELLLVRNAFGIVAVLLTGVLLFVLLRYAPVWVQVFFGYVWVWFLLIGAVRQIPELHRVRRAARADKKKSASDADLLAGRTHIPGPVWTGVFALGTVTALVAGGGYLLDVLPWH